ncbi:MAG: TM2 domain-containing protein [Clostridia bacterium]|nr:TM2 domain-containing protein [Clostridia bacterium]MBQ1982119.1 TM2 domain-containing protein [Clostridia bacterium]MBQ5725664.1 TM2 domain-containing protein [Clostridia bacterium]
MAELRKTLSGLDFIVKLILVIVYDVYGALYRISRGDTAGIIIGVLQIITGNFFGIMWIVDLITVILHKEVTVLANP